MSLTEDFTSYEIHPIDMMQEIASHQDWEFERVGEDQIAMALEGQWRSYAITLAWSAADQTLRLVCSFQMEPPQERLGEVLAAINAINDECWVGAFTWWGEQKMVLYRYALLLDGGQLVAAEQLDRMIRTATASCERFYPALQLVSWANRSADEAMQIAICEAYGHA